MPATHDEPRAARLDLTRFAAGLGDPDSPTLARVKGLADLVRPETLARCAVYGRAAAGAREAPAFLYALLEQADPALADAVFARVIDDGPMLRTWVRWVRCGALGRRSLGSARKRRVRGWLAARSDDALLRASVGRSPSLADVIRLVHPRPTTSARRALYAWLLRRPHDVRALPPLARALVEWRADPTRTPPRLPLPLLTSVQPTRAVWLELARRASWQDVRRNLNAFARRGLLQDAALVDALARRLADPARVGAAGVQPHQLLAARAALAPEVPAPLVAALDAALEVASASIPPLTGAVRVAVEDSEAMRAPLTGAGAVTRAAFADAVAQTIVRRSPGARVARAHPARLLPPEPADLVLVLAARGFERADLARWETARTRQARLAWLGLAPGACHAPARPDVLPLSGCSDGTFALLSRFAAGLTGPDPWEDELRRIAL